MKINIICFLFMIFLSQYSQAKNKITDLRLTKSGGIASLEVFFENPLKETPELDVKNDVVQLSIPDVIAWPKIEKKSTLNSNFDTTIMAYQFNKDLVRVRALLPYSDLSISESAIIKMGEKSIRLDFPVKFKKQVVVKEKSLIKKKTRPKKNASDYDEKYLEKILNDKEVAKIEKKTQKKTLFLEDQVKTKKSSFIKDESRDEFSISNYAGKFVGFLLLILGGFYFLVNFLKKGVAKKGRLGFLNKTSLVEVLSTNYIAPKKSVSMIRAHNQVFLVGVSENGINLISEINDVNGLFKEGEKQISGSNFDTQLTTSEEEDKEFKLKEILDVSEGKTLEAEPKKAKKKFSDHIKHKIKDMKQFQ